MIVLLGTLSFAAALIEFLFGRFVYSIVYGWHPFQDEGATRFFGWRPLLLLEDPNQIAMWWGTVAIAAMTLYQSRVKSHWATATRWWFASLVMPPFLFQAFGGALLTVLGGLLLVVRDRRFYGVLFGGIVVLAIIALLFRGPLLRTGRHLAETTSTGQALKRIVRDSPIGSLGWRIGREEDNDPLIRKHFWTGWGSTQFWKQDSTSVRPWGLVTLVLGAYGVVGCLVWCGMMAVPVSVVLFRIGCSGASDEIVVRGMAIIVLVHAIDATLNSAYFLPVVMLLGMMQSDVVSNDFCDGLPSRPD